MARAWPKGKPWDGSGSRLARFERCPREHRHRYVDRWPDPTRSDGRVGILVHAALETAARARLQVESAQPAELGELLAALGEATPGVDGVTPEELADARQLLEGLAPFDLAAGGVLLVEAPFTLVLEGGERFGGFFDVVRRGRDGALEVVDWKTGGAVMSDAEAELDVQVLLYLAAARELHLAGGGDPARPIRCVIHYVRSGVRVVTRWDPDLDRFIRARAHAAWSSWSSGNDSPRIGDHCAMCPYRDRCEPYRAHLEALAPYRDPPELKDLPFPALVRERQRMAETAKLAEGRRQDLDDELRRRIAASGHESVEVGRWRASVRERRTGTYDVAVIPELAAVLERDPYELMRKLARVTNADLRKLIEGNEEAEQIARSYRSEQTTRYLDVRGVRGPF